MTQPFDENYKEYRGKNRVVQGSELLQQHGRG